MSLYETLAIPAAPTLSNDEKRLFVASASSDMACISTQTGLEIWHMSGTSPFLAETRTAPDNSRVYVIQSADGRIFSQDQLTGKLEWVGSCDSFQEDCANSVRAHFDLSKAGEYMYYGDVMGRIIALKLGDLVDNSGSTSGPGTSGTIDWDAHSQNEEKSKSGSNFGGSIALIILAVLVAIGSTAYVMMVNAFKTVPHPQQEPQPEETIETSGRNDDDFALPIDSANAPDPYEDSMISQHTNSSTPTARDVTAFTWNARNRPKTLLDDSSDNASHASSHAPADRISKLLGTTNRITPIKEDFSYGASVLV